MSVLWKIKSWAAACHPGDCIQQHLNPSTTAARLLTGLGSQGRPRWAISGLASWEAERKV